MLGSMVGLGNHRPCLHLLCCLRTALHLCLLFPCPQVDKHIRRLDTDLARFEADLKEKQIESSDYDSSSSKGKKSEEGGGP